jgi:serine/threonine-protein kinase RsbW
MNKVIASLQVTADLEALKEVRHFVEKTAVARINNPQTISDIVLAVDEALTNIIRHGYNNQPGKIEITISCQQNQFTIRLYDWSANFDPTQVALPDLDTPLSQRKPGGMGVHIMRQLTDDLQYQILPDGRNELTLIKEI